MKKKHLSINGLILAVAGKNYLEIGYGNGFNFNLIECANKTAIDPELQEPKPGLLWLTSDDFFKDNKKKFDVIFIDGDHTAEQVEKDILNAWAACKKGGVIILHDINPPTEAHQITPRVQDSWTGDAWRAWVGFKDLNADVKTEYVEEKYGLGVIYKSGHKIGPGFTNTYLKYEDIEASRGYITYGTQLPTNI